MKILLPKPAEVEPMMPAGDKKGQSEDCRI